MPVRRFRTAAEMNQPLWRQPGDPSLFRAFAGLWAAGRRLRMPRFPPGVYRYRSIEDLQAQTERWKEENFRAFHAERH